MEHQLIGVIMVILSFSFSVFVRNNVDFLHVHGRKYKQNAEDVTQKLTVLAVPVNNNVGVIIVSLQVYDYVGVCTCVTPTHSQ